MVQLHRVLFAMRTCARKEFWVAVFFAIQFSICAAVAAPSAQRLGKLLGYPENEIIVENITDEERELWSIPTARERRQAAPMSNPQSLIAAYKVSARNTTTFYPMFVWIGKKGAFQNSESQKTFDLIAADEAKPVSQGGRGPFGPQSFKGLGSGGIYLGRIKVPSTIREMLEPQKKSAMISILYLPSKGIDLRIAFMANLEGGGDLIPLSGGEKYFNAFRPSKEGETEPRYDVVTLFSGLNQAVVSEAGVANAAPVFAPSQLQQEKNKRSGNDLEYSTPTPNDIVLRNQKHSVSWSLLVAGVLIIGAVVFYKIRR